MSLVKTKLLSFTFLVILSIPTMSSVYFYVRQQIMRHEMKEALEKQSLTTIVISSNKINWIEFGREALVNGHLFDVESYSLMGNKVQMSGLYDVEEDKLKELIKKIEQKSTRESNKYALLADLLQIFFQDNVSSPGKNIINYISEFNIDHDENLYSTSLNILIPPPKLK
jgi:hypothetical protein